MVYSNYQKEVFVMMKFEKNGDFVIFVEVRVVGSGEPYHEE